MSNYLKDNKELMKQWDYEKNKSLDLDKLTIGSSKKAWWKCYNGHEWKASIQNRAKRKSICPICKKGIDK